MRNLILAHRHKLRLVDQDVCRLQQRIAKKPVGAQILCREIFLLLLVRRYALKPTDAA